MHVAYFLQLPLGAERHAAHVSQHLARMQLTHDESSPAGSHWIGRDPASLPASLALEAAASAAGATLCEEPSVEGPAEASAGADGDVVLLHAPAESARPTRDAARATTVSGRGRWFVWAMVMGNSARGVARGELPTNRSVVYFYSAAAGTGASSSAVRRELSVPLARWSLAMST
jgi:hypothetical protein